MKKTFLPILLALAVSSFAICQEEVFVEGLAPVVDQASTITDENSILKVSNEVTDEPVMDVAEPIMDVDEPAMDVVTPTPTPLVVEPTEVIEPIEVVEEPNPVSEVQLPVAGSGHMTLPTELNRIAPAPVIYPNSFPAQIAPPVGYYQPVQRMVQPVVVRPVPVNRYVAVQPVQIRPYAVYSYNYQVQYCQQRPPIASRPPISTRPAIGSRFMRLFR